ncbi:two-component system response regulator YesN [Paenibacillus castaneae]|uniref:response regulator transcription factor n=1 Tax=Paenibacillus castaneae TaxID=474957 RepID=UPI00141BF2BE|nr:response regulator [Paenibacillus castaneae]NIK78076.1 two-component system response regulator YesN [Paenibacillus castaneae]
MYNLLIVDDEFSVVETLATTLPWTDVEVHTVYQATSAMQALEIINTHTVDIVITDIRMPEKSGLELIKEIYQMNTKIKCVLLTGYAEFEYAKLAITNQVVNYLLKPVSDEEVLNTISGITKQLSEEYKKIVELQRVMKTLQHHKPVLHANFLNDLLNGRKFSNEDLLDKLALLEIPFGLHQDFTMLAVRLEQDFSSHDRNFALFEFAIGNIAEEIFKENYDLFWGKDSQDYLVFLIKYKSHKENLLKERNDWVDIKNSLLHETALKLQTSVKKYLKGTISMMVSNWGLFPLDIPVLHQECITTIRKRIGKDHELFITSMEQDASIEFQTIQSFYEPPSLLQLFDTGRWEAIFEKLSFVFEELVNRYGNSQEHILEIYYGISGAFTYYAHKNGKRLEDILGEHFKPMVSPSLFRSVSILQNWSNKALKILMDDTIKDFKHGRSSVIQSIQEFVENHLEEDISLQVIADHVYLHPVYLSKTYKSETGENLSDYLLRLKMEKASYYLKNTNAKIYEVSTKLGYQNPPYFNKVFKKYYNVTPQEYREMGTQS